MTRPQNVGRDFKHVRKGSRVTNRANGFGTVAGVRSDVHCSTERARQRLTPLRRSKLSAEALGVESAVVVVALVRVPISICARNHYIDISLLRTPNPQREPQIGAFADGDRVSMLACRHGSELHQPDFGNGVLGDLVEDVSPLRQLIRLQAAGLMP